MTTETISKSCTKCKRAIAPENLINKKTSKDGFSSICRPCQREYLREHYRNNKQSYLDRNKIRSRKNREKIIDLKRRPCSDCGQTFHPYIMEFDHRDPATKTHNVSAIHWLDLKNIKAEIAKCDLVCANCHKLRTFRRLQETKPHYYVGF